MLHTMLNTVVLAVLNAWYRGSGAGIGNVVLDILLDQRRQVVPPSKFLPADSTVDC